MKESELQIMVADYLRTRYPKVLFHSDFGSGIKMPKGQAIKQKRQNGGRRGWPDMFIAEPRTDVGKEVNGKYELTRSHFGTKDNPIEVFNQPDNELYHIYNGLYLELKAEGNSPFKKDGTLKKDQHLEEQNEVLNHLREKGYAAYFAVGFEEAQKLIDDYLGGKR